jgi:thiamine-monophosphate kinase
MPLGERELVRWLQQRSGVPEWPVVVGIGDDMAIVEVGGDRRDTGAAVLLTSDMLLDGVHFDTAVHNWEKIGRKAIACSLSDCAAMGVRPVAATVSVAWPEQSDTDKLRNLFEGMWEIAGRFDCALVGGDTTSWRAPLAIDVAMIAAPYPDQPAVRRDRARIGDTLYVTGPLGGSRLGRHLTFTPRVREARSIAASLGPHLHAMLDLSDGLSIDLHRLCEASGVGADLVEELLEGVISVDARRASAEDGVAAFDHALNDGEDFELLLAVAGDAPRPPMMEEAFLHPIGNVTAEEGSVRIRQRDGNVRPLPPRGYTHLT